MLQGYRRDLLHRMEWVQMSATEMIRGLEHLTCVDRLRELWLFTLEKAPVRPKSCLPVLEGGVQEGCRETAYKGLW